MALAYLCSKLRRIDPNLKVVDHSLGTPYGIVVNHDLREGSAEEAANVASVLKTLGLKTEVVRINWNDAIGKTNPNDLPNIETLARTLRYRKLAFACVGRRINTLFTAHHEDDQYETVLMRLLSGHGYRGLQGMRPATDIPECYDLIRVYQSGFIDDQRHHKPLYNMLPTRRETITMRRKLEWEVDPEVIKKEIEAGLKGDLVSPYLSEYEALARGSKRAPPVPPLEFEDGGIMLYRPLLSFSKDRLIATCVENNVPWFEDHTNADQTLTMRNAVRHMWKNHTLPKALQKPAVLQLAAQCRARVATEEAAAGRLLSRVRIHEFGSNACTLVVTLPHLSVATVSRKSSRSLAARQKRLAQYRHIAALMMRRLISAVTPERELSQAAQLGHLVSMLFPSLADPASPPPEPKPYVICGVHFIPLVGGDYPLRWLLTRAPHVSNMPRPSATFPPVAFAWRRKRPASAWRMPRYMQFQSYDGRYWVGVKHRLPCDVVVAPFEAEHHKPFREGLATDKARRDLSAMLRRYAPGKIRYALPAVYATVDVSRLLKGGEWWPPELACPLIPAKLLGREGGEGNGEKEEQGDWAAADEEGTERPDRYKQFNLSEVFYQRLVWETELKGKPAPQLLALPTLGVALPGVEDWLKCEVRYRKVDAEVLRMSKIGGDFLEWREFRERARWWYRYTRKRKTPTPRYRHHKRSRRR
ncbi:hypothetical protein VTK26DRAFT_3159 [Humicola hyalothermophila]